MDLCTLTGSVNYFPLRVKLYTVTDSTLGILTPRRQESSVKPKLLIPAMHLSAEILKTRGDFPHANGALDSCRAIDAWPPLPPVSSTEVTHNPCSSFIIEMWMRKVRGWLSSIGQHRNIWLSLRRLCQGTPLHCNRGWLFECKRKCYTCVASMHFEWLVAFGLIHAAILP